MEPVPGNGRILVWRRVEIGVFVRVPAFAVALPPHRPQVVSFDEPYVTVVLLR